MSKKIVLRKGLNIPVKGAAELKISNVRTPDTVAIQPTDFKGLLPRLLVREGDTVLCGSPVIADKAHTDILLTSPCSGKVKEVVRGEKRKLLAVLIENDHEGNCVDFGALKCAAVDAAKVKELLLASGLWPMLVQRPYGIVANPDVQPKAIFVSTFDTAPLAADADFCYAEDIHAIQAAILALGKIAKVHVSVLSKKGYASPFAKLEGCEIHSFEGIHPAGNVGVQISHISPICKDETVWTISMAGLVAVGRLMTTGKLDLRRKVAVCGPAAIEPSYVVTLPGMPMKDIMGHIGNDSANVRVISGDILSGKTAGPDGYLGIFHSGISIIREGNEKEYFGWIRPIRWRQFSNDRTYFGWLMPWRKYDMDTNLHGGPRAFIMNDSYYGKVLPMDIFPLYLTKACLAGDIDKMEKFGIYEVLPEDLALCEFVDPSKNYIQEIIAQGIDLMLKEMA